MPVDFLEEKLFYFQCVVTSDPSTPPTVRWYKTEPTDYLVRNELPYVFVAMETLVIRIDPKCSANCTKYLGEYRCVGDNGYSRDSRTIKLAYQPPEGKYNTCKCFFVSKCDVHVAIFPSNIYIAPL